MGLGVGVWKEILNGAMLDPIQRMEEANSDLGEMLNIGIFTRFCPNRS